MNIEILIQNKEDGFDCNQNASAYIKQLVKRIEKTFPNEFDEALDEMKKP